MIDKLITSDTRVKLLLRFFLNPGTRGYLRQLASDFNESTNGIRLELNRLTEAQMLTVHNEGRNKIYQANSAHPLFLDLRNIVLKSTGIDKVISNILKKAGHINMAFIRGDYARGNDSGLIELVIVGDEINEVEIERVRKKTELLIKRKISILYLNTDEYKQLKQNFSNENLLVLYTENDS